MVDDSLDSLVNFEKKDENGVSNDALVTQNRPRLKKIKRPKIRPMPIDNIEQEVLKNNDNQSVTQESENDGIIDGAFLSDKDDELNQFNNQLMTSASAQNLLNENSQSHIMEALDPDLEYLDDNDDNNNIYIDTANYTKKSYLYMVGAICLILGLFIGKTLFSSETIENHGLEGVVVNPDIPAGRPRCGLTDKSQACVFYLMNWYKQELTGRDFYKLAAQLTGREEYMIETDNLRYAQMKIKPGNIAQLNIPALK